jgi:hypothetical protein
VFFFISPDFHALGNFLHVSEHGNNVFIGHINAYFDYFIVRSYFHKYLLLFYHYNVLEGLGMFPVP